MGILLTLKNTIKLRAPPPQRVPNFRVDLKKTTHRPLAGAASTRPLTETGLESRPPNGRSLEKKARELRREDLGEQGPPEIEK